MICHFSEGLFNGNDNNVKFYLKFNFQIQKTLNNVKLSKTPLNIKMILSKFQEDFSNVMKRVKDALEGEV